MSKRAPFKCPMCSEVKLWKRVNVEKKGFSFGKAAFGGLLIGPFGLIGGGLGKKYKTYACGKCQFKQEYRV